MAEIETKFQGGQAHYLFRQSALVAVNEATFLQRAVRKRSASGSLVSVFSVLVFAAVVVLFLVPIEKRVLIEGTLSVEGDSVHFEVSPQIARHAERRGDVTVRSGATLLAALQEPNLSASVESVDWRGDRPRLVLNPSANNFQSGGNYIVGEKLLISLERLRLLDILIGANS
ncbi:hypothetical protein [Phaeobacter sp.]|uniref:hypothetical protein n=1 Tax=Phaeobacter sp. TaxID=1902409 RepID=UPI0025DB66C8|nr:hypothetical protein [Phaeobacter sp.]